MKLLLSINRTLLTKPATISAAYSPGYNPRSHPGGNSGNPNSSPDNGGSGNTSSFDTIYTAHAVLATLAFAFLFPLGGILVRTASFEKLWLVHGILQIVAFILFIAAFGLGVRLSIGARFWNDPHQIIGMVLFAVLRIQPLLGFLHHASYKKRGKRSAWSHLHNWTGRIIITLGVINGGLGLKLAKLAPYGRPESGDIVGYSVVAGIIWLLYVFATIFDESKRSRARRTLEPPNKRMKSLGPIDLAS